MTALFWPCPWAVHLSDGMLTEAWWAGGLVVAALLSLLGAWRLRDEDVPRVALMTSVFFVSSLLSIPVPGGPKTHLLLNGLLGVVLGRKALLAIPAGLTLQAVLFGHGGYTTLGINSVVMGLPAVLAWGMFSGLGRLPWARRPWFRGALVSASVFLFGLSLVYSVVLLVSHRPSELAEADLGWANRVTFSPVTLGAAAGLSVLAAWLEYRLEQAPEFPLGLIVGEAAVLATLALHTIVLIAGGRADWHSMALVALIIHLPLAVVEGVILGFTVGFLARVKPEMLGWKTPEVGPCAAETVP